MKVYIINSSEARARVSFAIALAKSLKKDGKTLLISTKRNDVNIEDYFGKDGMISYDLADYFKEVYSFKDVKCQEEENLDFIIAPLLEGKHEISKEDLQRLVKEEAYEYIVIDKLDLNLIDEKKSVKIIKIDQVDESIEEDSFFIDEVDENLDIRLFKEKIETKGKIFLGKRRANEVYDKIIDNLINGRNTSVASLSFFEKLKMKFKK